MKSKHAAMAIVSLLLIVSLTIGMQTTYVAKAQSRTIVVPDDYSTIQEAVANAVNKDTIFVKKGTYNIPENQTLLLSKSISLIGEDANNTIMRLKPPLVPYTLFTQTFMVHDNPIKINASKVQLSNFTIITDGGAILATGDELQAENNLINTSLIFTGNKTAIINNTITSIRLTGSNGTIKQNSINGTGNIRLSCEGSFNIITSNRVTGAGGGIHAIGSNNVIFANSIITESQIEAGLKIAGQKNVAAKNSVNSFVCIGDPYNPESSFNTICGNTFTDDILSIVGNNNTFEGNYIQGLVLGNTVKDASNNVFYNNNFDFLQDSARPAGEKWFTVWKGVQGPVFLDNGKEGNYWSDYNGSDLNLDGKGDSPYKVNTKDPLNYHYVADFDIADFILTDRYPLMAPFDIDSIHIELPTWANTSLSNLLPTSTLSPTATLSPTNSPTQQLTLSPEPTATIPEFPVWVILPLTIVLVMMAIMIIRRKQLKQSINTFSHGWAYLPSFCVKSKHGS